jgi:hypothetical protein
LQAPGAFALGCAEGPAFGAGDFGEAGRLP